MKDLLNNLKAIFDEYSLPLTHKVEKIKEQIEEEIALISLGEKLDVNLSKYYYSDYVQLSSEISLNLFTEGGSKSIYWPDDGKQPSPGWYLVIGLPTGPYILNGDYPRQAFSMFFEELKSFGAKHVDSHNHYLYFSLDENPEPAREVYKAYGSLYKKYYDMGKEEVLQSKIARAEEELRKLKEGK